MSSKTSCFKTVIKSDIKRLWWISAIAAAFMMLFVTMPFVESVKYNLQNSNYRLSIYGNESDWVLNRLGVNYFFSMMLGGFLSLGLFSYLNNSASVTFKHALPVTRIKIMLYHTVSALIFFAFPILLNGIVVVSTLSGFCSVAPVFVNMGLCFVLGLLIFSLFTFVGMLTGNTPSHGIFSVVLILLPLFISAFLYTLCDNYLYGFSSNNAVYDKLVEYIYLSEDALMSPKVLIYIAMIAIFYALALFVYNKRHLENYGEVIAFPNLKGLFKFAFGVCFGILGYFYCNAFWSFDSILVMLVFGSIGVIIANMLSNKSFSLRGCRNALIGNAIVVLVLFAFFALDITGFENRVPDADDVECVTIEHWNNNGRIHAKISDEYGYDNVQLLDYYDAVFTDKDDIQLFVNLHKDKVSDRTVDVCNFRNYISGIPYNIEIAYTLKNGSVMKRVYVLDDEDILSFYSKIMETDVYKKYRYPIFDGTQKKYTKAEVFSSNGVYLLDSFDGNSASTAEIIEALKADRKDMTFSKYIHKFNSTNECEILLTYTMKALDSNGSLCNIELTDNYEVSVYDFNTIKALKKLGVNALPPYHDKSQVKKAEISYRHSVSLSQDVVFDDYYEYDEYNEKVYVETDVQYPPLDYKTVTDEQQLSQLCDYALNYKAEGYETFDNFVAFDIKFVYGDGNSNHVSFIDSPERLPEIIKDNLPIK